MLKMSLRARRAWFAMALVFAFAQVQARDIPREDFLNDLVLRWRTQSHAGDAAAHASPLAAEPQVEMEATAYPEPIAPRPAPPPTLRRSVFPAGSERAEPAQGFGRSAAPPRDQPSLASIIRQFRS